MAKYAIVTQTPQVNGITYTIVMDDENGHSEQQDYFIATNDKTDVLANAAKHFASEWAARASTPVLDPTLPASPLTWVEVSAVVVKGGMVAQPLSQSLN